MCKSTVGMSLNRKMSTSKNEVYYVFASDMPLHSFALTNNSTLLSFHLASLDNFDFQQGKRPFQGVQGFFYLFLHSLFVPTQ